MKKFKDLSEAEILALAISNEEEDARIYATFANRLRAGFSATAAIFDAMVAEENEHRAMLLDLYKKRFGDQLPYITRQDVSGFLKRRPVWLMDNLRVDAARRQTALMELEASEFYARAAERAQDVETRKLLGDLAAAEREHEARAIELENARTSSDQKSEEELASRRLFVLQIVQPGLAGLIDGSVSTLAPIFAAAFATHNSHETFLIGLAASIGAGISMGLTEALSDDGEFTRRGSPLIRGVACGVMTALGGLGHTLPYLIPSFWTATMLAGLVVVVELVAIACIRWKYMETPFHSAIIQVVLGGALVLLSGILIGGA